MPHRRCIFVIEADPEIADLLVAYLRAEGFRPCLFSDGRVAVAAIRSNDLPTAVIVDIAWSGIRGVIICDAVRDVSAVPILILTRYIEEVEIIQRINCQVDGYLCKPFGPREVMTKLESVIHSAENRSPLRCEVAAAFA
jgi:two-component system response regulator BaeR